MKLVRFPTHCGSKDEVEDGKVIGEVGVRIGSVCAVMNAVESWRHNKEGEWSIKAAQVQVAMTDRVKHCH